MGMESVWGRLQHWCWYPSKPGFTTDFDVVEVGGSTFIGTGDIINA